MNLDPAPRKRLKRGLQLGAINVPYRPGVAIAYIHKYDKITSLGFGVISFVFLLRVGAPSGIVFFTSYEEMRMTD